MHLKVDITTQAYSEDIRSSERIMKKHKQRRFFFVLCSTSAFLLLLGVALGTFLQRPHVGAHAATAQSSSSNVMTGVHMSANVVPLHPMYDMAVKMNANVANVANATN